MAWILQYIIWITFMTTSAYSHISNSSNPYYQYDAHVNVEHQTTLQRNDRDNYHHDTPNRGLPQRSIFTYSDTQIIQEKDQKRQKVKETSPQIENGSYKILNISLKNKKGSSIDTSMTDRIVFPGPTSKSAYNYEPEIPEECKSKSYCESIPNYPVEYVASLLAELGDSVNRFHMDEIDVPEIVQRVGPIEENLELCESRKQILHPEGLLGADGKWYTVINRRVNPVQGFLAEVCTSEKSKCSSIINRLERGYSIGCHQKLLHRKVVVFDSNMKMTEKSFEIPSCCTCVANKTDIDV